MHHGCACPKTASEAPCRSYPCAVVRALATSRLLKDAINPVKWGLPHDGLLEQESKKEGEDGGGPRFETYEREVLKVR